MSLLRSLSDGLQWLFRKERVEGELDEELRGFLEMAAEEKMKQGMNRKDALRAVRLEQGNLEVTKEAVRSADWASFVETCWQDLRFAARMLRKNPGFSALAIATLALCIGANTGVFSLMDAVILRPLAYPEVQRLFAVHEVVPAFSQFAPPVPVNAMHFQEWRKSVHSFDQIALLGGIKLNLTGEGDPERIAAARVTPNLFPLLGIQTQLGRTFLDEEDHSGKDHVVILNHSLWTRRLGADPNVIGRKIILDGEPYEVIGVLRQNLHFPKLSQLYAMSISEERPEIWKPFAVRDDELEAMGDFNYACIARVRPGFTESQALSELNAVEASIAEKAPEKEQLLAKLVPLQDQITGRARAGLQILLAAVAAVLLIGCVNIANLLFARATARRQELAIRSALGASRRRLAFQLLAESLLLSGVGGLLGLGVGLVCIRIMLTYAPIDLPRLDEVHLDGRVLLFTLALSLLIALVFALLPSWRLINASPQDAMKSSARGSIGGQHASRVRSLLVGMETGLSAMCLIAGGLLLHSLVNLLNTDKGFGVQRIVVVDLSLPDSRYPEFNKQVSFGQTLLERTQALPGVISAGISNKPPLSGEGGNNLLSLENTNVPIPQRPLADIRIANPQYFSTMNIPLQSGRIFDNSDRSRHVALVSELTAQHLWPSQNPIGQRLRIGGDTSPLLEVLGVVGDVRAVSLDRVPTMTVYTPYWERFRKDVSLVVKTEIEPMALSSALRDAIHQIDSDLPVPALRTMQEIVSGSVAQRRFQMTLVLLFAAIATLLASVGIYGVVSYSVAQRTPELGIRIAVGAQTFHIAEMVLWHGFAPVLTGLLAGIGASLAFEPVLASLLFGLRAGDPLTILAVVFVLCAVALAAIYVPVRKAMRIDPATALRYE
jgi:predicted permease